jgi:P4 family phage/plasmid primase-like protien
VAEPVRGEPGTPWWLGLWDGNELALNATCDALPANDVDAAGVLMNERPGQFHFAVGSGVWLIWDGRCHRPDASNTIVKRIADLGDRIRQLLEYAQQRVYERTDVQLPDNTPDPARAKARELAWAPWKVAEKYAAGLMRSAGQTALRSVMEGLAGVSDDWLAEVHPEWLNCANGTLDLKTGQLRPHDPDDQLTYCVDIEYEPYRQGVSCPQFEHALHRMTGGDASVTWYLASLFGYSLLGDNREQRIAFISGPSGSGKSLVLGVVSEVLGELAHSAQTDLICVVRHGRNARTENSVRGKRFVTITETSAYLTIEEAQLKRLTGERWISVNQHYAKTEIKTPVTWTIFVATNAMPVLANYDAAMRRRVVVIPGGPGLDEGEMVRDKADQILATERNGILALLVAACQHYFASGQRIEVPVAVQMETEKYAHEQNTIEQFLDEATVPGGYPGFITRAAAYLAYKEWSAGSSSLGRNTFQEQLRSVNAVSYHEGSKRYYGVSWNEEFAVRYNK